MRVSSVTSLDTIYSIRVDDFSTTVTYVGEAPLSSAEEAPVWRIKKIESLGSQLNIKWADGNQFFDNIWTNHTSLTYS